MEKKAKWTFMVYLAGDNNLSAAGDTDLGEMRRVGSTPEVNVLLEFDNAGDEGTRRYLVQKDGHNERVESLGETDSGDPQVLLNFISWVKENYPAERYALILWNHGNGWVPTEIDRLAKKINARGWRDREATERSASSLQRLFFRPTLENLLSLPSSTERAICSDDGSGHSIDTIELGKVLKQAKTILEQPLDMLGMDACLMSNLEVAYQVKPYVSYIVASEESEPNQGWPYEQVLRFLVENHDLSTAELSAHIVDAYIKSYMDMGYPGDVTQSALDLSKIDTLTIPLDKLAEALLSHMPAASQEIWNSQRGSAHFYYKTLWDIAHFCGELEKLTQNSAVRAIASDVRQSLKAGAGNFVIAESHNGDRVSKCAGVSIYLPYSDLSRYYDELDWAQEQPRWAKLLRAYLN